MPRGMPNRAGPPVVFESEDSGTVLRNRPLCLANRDEVRDKDGDHVRTLATEWPKKYISDIYNGSADSLQRGICVSDSRGTGNILACSPSVSVLPLCRSLPPPPPPPASVRRGIKSKY